MFASTSFFQRHSFFWVAKPGLLASFQFSIEIRGNFATLASVSQEGYPGSVKESELFEHNSLIIFLPVGINCLQKNENNFWQDLGRGEADLL